MNRDKMIEALAEVIEAAMDNVHDMDVTFAQYAAASAAAVLDLCGPDPLVWEHYDKSDTYPEAWTANTPRGFITILKDAETKYRIIWEWVVECDTDFPTLQAAQEAAQSYAIETWLKQTPLGKLVGVV